MMIYLIVGFVCLVLGLFVGGLNKVAKRSDSIIFAEKFCRGCPDEIICASGKPATFYTCHKLVQPKKTKIAKDEEYNVPF